MTKRKKSKSGDEGNVRGLTDKVLHAFHKYPKRRMNYKQVAKAISVTNKETRRLIVNVLDDLVKKEVLREDGRGGYKLNVKQTYLEGVVDVTARGSAFIICEGVEDDIFVSQRNLNGAFNGDTVKIHVTPRGNKRGGASQEGEVVEIIKRGKEVFVGVMQITDKHAFFVPDSNKVPMDFFVPLTKLNKAKDGQKVIVKITDWPKDAKSPFAEVVKVLGNPGDHQTEMHAILWEFGLPYEFPPEVEAYAENIPMEVPAEEIKKRRDMRGITTFTIDPVDAKDFDDALSIQKLPNGNWEIGIHIADVSHYMPLDSTLDKEAQKRATSVYLVDRVVPMLPEKLSNGVCSLRPHEEKLAFSAIFEMDDDAKIYKQWFGRTVIYSDHRFAYEDAQEIIEGADGPLKDEVLKLYHLSVKMRHDRFKHGAIDFGGKEVKFQLDEEGAPVGIYFKESKEANKLIEEFMLLANKKVTEFVSKGEKNSKRTFVYRVHDKPNPDKFQIFSQFVKKLGFKMEGTDKVKGIASALNGLMKDIQGTKQEDMLESLAIRTMAKAEYDVKNIGHYGLGFEYYTHFTSPIRRYPDVMVHRLLQHYLDGKSSPEPGWFEQQCKHSSEREKAASDAERASIKYKQVEFMEDHIGEEFEAVISGITEFGIYAEIVETKCEGMIKVSDIDSDFYIYDQDNYRLIGKKFKRIFRFGDRIIIKVKRADLMKKQLDLEFIKSLEEGQE